jgi:hypothetical protein
MVLKMGVFCVDFLALYIRAIIMPKMSRGWVKQKKPLFDDILYSIYQKCQNRCYNSVREYNIKYITIMEQKGANV